MVKPGDTIKVDQSLVTVESDKASMEIPSTHAGVVKEVNVKVGDKLNEGSLLLTVEEAGAGAAAAPAAAPAPAAASAAGRPAARRLPRRLPPRPTDSYAPAHKLDAAAPNACRRRAASYSGQVDVECEMMVLGAGPGGYSAAFRSADLG
jgi:dihydrolipoamide dehydrogenase